jgi:hypothetical protein
MNQEEWKKLLNGAKTLFYEIVLTMMISEWWFEKDLQGSGCGLILRNCLKRLRKTTKDFSQDSWSPSQDMNLGCTEYETSDNCSTMMFYLVEEMGSMITRYEVQILKAHN